MKLYGSLPLNILSYKIQSIEFDTRGGVGTVKELIDMSTDDDIEHSTYKIRESCDPDWDDDTLESLTLWTKYDILKLCFMSGDCFMLVLPRKKKRKNAKT